MLIKWSNHINKKSKVYAFIAALFICMLLVFSRVPEIDGQLKGLNIENTTYYKSGKEIANFFEISDFIEVKITPESCDAKTVFNSLESIEKNLTNSFKNIEVKSIHNAQSVLLNESDTNLNIATVLTNAKGIPIVQDLISNDAHSFLLLVTLDSTTQLNITRFDSLLSKNYDGIKDIKSLSSLHVENEIKQSLTKDILTITITLLLFFSVFIIYVFRDYKSLIYTAVIILVSIIPTLFLFTILDVRINLITALSIPIVLVLSLADAVHILTGFFNNETNDSKEIIQHSMKSYIVPSFLTSLTTTIAFGSFMLNSAESIQHFGLIISCTVMPSFFLTYMVSPYILSFFTKKEPVKNGIHKLLDGINRFKKQLTYILIAASILAIPFVSKLSFNTDFDSFIPKGSPTELNRKEITKDFNSQLSLSILMKSKTENTSKTIEKDLIKLVKELDTISSVGTIKSIKNQIDFKSKLGPYGKYVHFPNKRNPYRSKDKQKYRLELRLTDVKYIQETNQIVEHILQPYESDYTFHIYSKALLLDEVNQNVAESLFYSLLFSFIFIFFSILILTKSVLTTVVSILANTIPLSFIVLIFHFGNLDLNILTAITTVICLGIIVDDTIHVIYRQNVLNLKPDELGYGIITTSLILIGGFSTFMLSSFEPSQVFGHVSAIVFCVTMIADLTLLPFLLDLTSKKKLPSSPLK
jgi:predicted RND superfamily exporter protein